jgi:hypothetical protein
VQEGRDEATLERFFERLGPARSAVLHFVTADAATWIKNVLARRCPNATVCLDPFHVVSWATDALDQVRRAVWNEARRCGQTSLARELKGARYALWKNPEHLTQRQTAKLSDIARINRPLFDPRSSTYYRNEPAARAEQRTRRIRQYPHPSAHPNRLRLPLGTAAHRPCHARLGRTVPAPARSVMTTHGKSSRPAFPPEHRQQLHSTNPLERLNKEIKRRSNVVGIFPNRTAPLCSGSWARCWPSRTTSGAWRSGVTSALNR